MAHAVKGAAAVLNSWKEIAQYLDRGVRTVQRWEQELRLPVHRIGKGKRSPVYALVPEVRFWLTTVEVDSERPERQLVSLFSRQKNSEDSPLRHSHDLITKSRDLVRHLAETSVRQQREAEILQKRIIEMRARMR
jgi:hypothetical protein